MAKYFSPLKALKVGLSCLALAGTCLLSTTASAQYVKANGSQIVDGSGNPIFFNGANLGNWLVWEGYLMVGHNGYLTHSQFLAKLGQTFGDAAKAKQFETNWRLNYVTSDTIDELAGLGYNSVRVPFNYKLFWNDQTNNVTDEGFQYIDRLVGYCKNKNMYILLDMHGAPGYQNPGDHSDNGNSKGWDDKNPAGKAEDRRTVTFWDDTTETNIGRNVYIASRVWQHIAARYQNEPVIWGYDLLNEPVSKEGEGWRLIPAYKHMINAIRQVDKNHTVVLEGDWWGSYMGVFTTKIDNNMVLQTHHYIHGNAGEIPKLYERATIANSINVPIILGEFGEEENFNNLRAIADIARAEYDGSFAWSFKKVSMDKTLWRINPPQSYKNVISALESGRRANAGDIDDIVNNFAITGVQNRNKLGNTDWFQDFYEKTTTPFSSGSGCGTRSAYKAVTLPGVVQAEDFDKGCAGVVYADSTAGNAGATSYRNTDVDIGTTADSSGLYVGWTTQGEWLEYTVNVAQAGEYTFNFRYAAVPYGATVTVTAGSNSVLTNLNPTGGWDVWANAPSGKAYLAAGSQTIRVTVNGGSNLNSFTAAAVTNSFPPVAAISGTYAIISKASQMALEVQSGDTFNSAKVQQWSYYGLPHQKWKITRDGDAYKIIDFNSGKALDVIDNSRENKAKLQIWEYAGGANQRWKIDYNSARNSYSIKSVATDKGLDVPDGISQTGLLMQMWDFYAGNINQEWELRAQ